MEKAKRPAKSLCVGIDFVDRGWTSEWLDLSVVEPGLFFLENYSFKTLHHL